MRDKVKKLVSSMRFKIIATMLIFGDVIAIALLAFLIPYMQKTVKNDISANMLDLATAYSQVIDKDLEGGGSLNDKKLTDILSNVKIKGVDSSYAYLVDKNGTMIYHPTAEKIGQKVENQVVTRLVADIAAGKKIEPAVVSYDFRGTVKYAGYSAGKYDSYIIVISADEDEILSGVYRIRNIAVTCATLALIICSIILAEIVKRVFFRPLSSVIEGVNSLSYLDLHTSTNHDKLNTRKDEIGDISRSVDTLRETLTDIAQKLNEVSGDISSTAENISKETENISELSETNSATTQELAASMEETSATISGMSQDFENISNATDIIAEKTSSGEKLSDEMHKKAETAAKEAIENTAAIEITYNKVRDDSAAAIEKSKAVSKINELTKSISEIASQTNLLSLNASIEAARAGDAGKGFSVVASEIRKLAEQSRASVSEIETTVSEVEDSVAALQESLEEVLDFLNSTVQKDYKDFVAVNQGFTEQTKTVRAAMVEITDSVASLRTSIASMADSAKCVSTAANESAQGVSDIAGKTSDVVNSVSAVKDTVSSNLAQAETLNEIVNAFQM